jgi:hypothetical protein
MTSHLALMVLFAFFVSATFATLMRDSVVEQLRLGARLMGGFVAGGIVLGWLLYALPV